MATPQPAPLQKMANSMRQVQIAIGTGLLPMLNRLANESPKRSGLPAASWAAYGM